MVSMLCQMDAAGRPPCQGRTRSGRSRHQAFQPSCAHLSRSSRPAPLTHVASSQHFPTSCTPELQCSRKAQLGAAGSARRTRLCRVSAAAFDVDSLALDIPDIDGDINSVQFELGAVFNDEGIALNFNNHREALEAALSGVALVDLSHWGRLRVTGAQRIAFLQHQSTNDLAALKPGQGCDTTFLTTNGAVFDFATALVSERNVLLLTHPETSDMLQRRFALFAYPNDDVQVHNVSSKCAMLALVGPDSDAVLQQLGGAALTVIGAPPGSHQLLAYKQNAPVLAIAGTGLGGPGYTLVVDETIAGEVYALFAGKGCVPMGQEEWESARILAGHPSWNSELSVAVGPDLAGLARTLAPGKQDRYIGKEALQASLAASASRPSHHLIGLQLAGPLDAGAPITSGMDTIGFLTSTAQDAEGVWIGLGYLLCAAGETSPARFEGAGVAVGGTAATVRPLPFASWITDPAAFTQASSSSSSGSSSSSSTPGSEPGPVSKPAQPEIASASPSASVLAPAERDEKAVASPRELNHWRLIVDRSMTGLRGARVVDIEQIQRDTRS